MHMLGCINGMRSNASSIPHVYLCFVIKLHSALPYVRFTCVARVECARHVGYRWLIDHSTACVCSKHVLVQKKALLDFDSCKVQAVEGRSVMLHSGVGLLRKAEVDAHRKVAIQVCGSHCCCLRTCM